MIRNRMTVCGALLLAAALLTACPGQRDEGSREGTAASQSHTGAGQVSGLAAQAQAALERAFPADGPGGTAIIARDGEVLWSGARGIADLEHGVAMETDMVFRLASLTKQFTGVAVLMLAERGKLDVDEPIQRYLPDYDTGGKTVTVAQLLDHTGGIPSYTSIPGYMDTKVRQDLSVEELIDSFRDLPLDFEPGERFSYSNSGYVLLGAIIEAASGMTYEDFIEQEIFAPLGMQDSRYGRQDELVQGRVRGYVDDRDDGFRPAQFLSMTQPYAAGSLLSSVEDLARWGAGLFGGELIEPASLERMVQPATLNDGTPSNYGFGWGVGDKLRGRTVYSHGGGIFGFSTRELYIPDEQVFVAVLSNHGDGGQVGPLTSELAALAMDLPFPVREVVELPHDEVDGLRGIYRGEDDRSVRVLSSRGRIQVTLDEERGFVAAPIGPRRFMDEDGLTYVEFASGDDGVTTIRVFEEEASDPIEASWTDEELIERPDIEVAREILESYLGKYRLELGLDLEFVDREGRMTLLARGNPELPLFAESSERFVTEWQDVALEFQITVDGSVTGVVLEQQGERYPGKRLPE